MGGKLIERLKQIKKKKTIRKCVLFSGPDYNRGRSRLRIYGRRVWRYTVFVRPRIPYPVNMTINLKTLPPTPLYTYIYTTEHILLLHLYLRVRAIFFTTRARASPGQTIRARARGDRHRRWNCCTKPLCTHTHTRAGSTCVIVI